MKILHLPFCLRYLLFLFAFWLLWLGLPMLCWTEMVRVGILVLFQNTAGRLLAFHHLVLYWLWVSQMTSIMMRYVSSISLWWEFLSWILNFIKCFFCIYWDDHVFFFLFFCWCDAPQWLISICWIIPVTWNEPNLILVFDMFYVLLDSVY